MKILILILLLVPSFTFALEVDEKLTVRIVKTTDTRKTIMLNRGTEDGLVEGDHARFIVTAGIVARAVCVKVSPTRSVWSVYRLVNADFVVTDAVMTIKITPPVKITKDETQAIVQEDVPTKVATDPAALGIPLAEGARDLENPESMINDEADMRELESVTITEKSWEIFSHLNISGMASSTKTTGAAYKGSQASHQIGIGIEKYSQREREWYSRFSLFAGIDLMRLNAQAYNGAKTTNDVTEFSFGTHWHPGSYPSSVMTFIPYFHLAASMGTAKSTFQNGDDSPSSTNTWSANGGTSGFSLGFGYKFYTQRGFGARILADYYVRQEKYKADANNRVFNRSVTGPRLTLGLSYRF